MADTKLSALTVKEEAVADPWLDRFYYFVNDGATDADKQRATTPLDFLLKDRRRYSHWMDDLYSSGLAAQYTTGTGSNFQDNTGSVSHPGVYGSETGTGSTGAAGIGNGNAYAFFMGGGRMYIATWIKTPAALSDGTDTYTLFSGLTRSNLTYAPADCIAFRYAHSVNSGKWQLTCRSGSSESVSDSGVTVAADTWYLLVIDINAAANSVTGYIATSGGALTQITGAAITTNIPTAESFWHQCIIKSAGTTNRKIASDFYGWIQDFTTAR